MFCSRLYSIHSDVQARSHEKYKPLTLKTIASSFHEIRTLLFIGVTPYVKTYVEAERTFNMGKPVVMKTHQRNVRYGV
jgi:hypothetical protein